MPRRMQTLLIGVVALATACGGGGGAGQDYPDEVVEQFLASCTAQGASREVCQCALDELEEQYSLEEFTTESVRLSQGEASPEFEESLTQAAVRCQTELGG